MGRARNQGDDIMGRLTDKVALITGATGGIGRAAAALFVEEGARVMLVDLDDGALGDLAAGIGAGKAAHVAADVSDQEQMVHAISETARRFGGIDIALLNAGIEGRIASIGEQAEADFDRVMAINVRGVWLGLKYVMPEITKRGGGSIVVTSSTAGIRAVPGLAPYVASKHAVLGLMRAAAMEGAVDKVRVNSVNPAATETDMIRRLEHATNPDRSNTRGLAAFTPLRRYGQPEEVAKLMLFLASDDSSFCTGGVYMVDGGVSAGRA